MKALLLSRYNQLELADLPAPQPGPHEVLIRVAACGICGSDVHGYDGSSGRRIPPLVMGHEAAGVIAARGSEVTGFAPGDRVTFDSTVYCGTCAYCRSGRPNLCDNREVIGVSCGDYRRAGAFAEFVTVPDRILYRLPDTLSDAEAAMLEAVSVALHAVRVSEAKRGQSALVIGAGMIGLLTLQAARAAGCSGVLIADVDASRLALAQQVGADHTIHISGDNLVSAVLAHSPGGVDQVFEAVGRDQTVRGAVDCCRKGGTITLIGNISPEVTLPLQKVVSRELRLQGTAASSGEYPLAIDMVTSGRIQVKPLISAVAPLEEGASWFARLHAGEPGLMKVVLSPSLPAGSRA